MPEHEHEHEHDAFRLPTDLADEEKTAHLARALSAATHDPRPAHTLAQIRTALAARGDSDLRAFLDPLAVLPDVLTSARAGAEGVLAVLGEAASAKEVVVGAQEIVERLEAEDDDDDNDDNDDDNDDDGTGARLATGAETDEEPSAKASLATRVARLMALYACAVPRLNQRRLALDTLQSIVPNLEPLVYRAAARATATESRALVAAASSLATSARAWVQAQTKAGDDADAGALARCTVLLASVLDATLEACAGRVACSRAQRAFEARFSRLVVRSAVRSGWEAGEDAMSAAVAASKALGRTSASLLSNPSIAALILLAHASPPEPLTPAALTPLLPVLLSALDIGIADEPLYLLLVALLPSPASSHPPTGTGAELPPDLVLPLTPVLASLCSAHPDPPTRHLAFRLLSLALRATPAPLRLQVLRDLTDPAEDANPPQMRAAAVGLVKESVLAALGAPAATEPGAPAGSADVGVDVFASPALLSALGAHVFRAHPPDLFVAESTTADAFMRSAEPARLAECLALYYVLLRRDVQNRTGIRDRDTIRNIEQTFVGPMRAAVARWLAALGDELHAVMPLAALQTNIERVDAAVGALALAPAE